MAKENGVQGDLIRQRPQYQVMDRAFLMDDRLGVHRIYDPNAPDWPKTPVDPNTGAGGDPVPMLVFYDGKPGKVLKPHNQAARAVWLEHFGKPFEDTTFRDPIGDLTIISKSGPEDLKKAVVTALTEALLPILNREAKAA